MNLSMVIDQIIEAASTLTQVVPGLVWYLFGSSLKDFSSAKDIDILIVYQHLSDSVTIREHLKAIGIPLPLHVTLLTTEEDAELQFVKKQKCLEIFPNLSSIID